jgi:hypothetical protein
MTFVPPDSEAAFPADTYSAQQLANRLISISTITRLVAWVAYPRLFDQPIPKTSNK